MKPKKVYWDTSCFISLVSGDQENEAPRASICEDILHHARNEQLQIFTSVWTIAETIWPKSKFVPEPLPEWSQLLQARNKDGLIYPKAGDELQMLWTYFKRNTTPTRILPESQATRIRQMFEWKFIHLVQVIPAIAHKAVDIAREKNLKPGDAVHVATALHRGCDVIHRWDKDFEKSDSLVKSCEPDWMTDRSQQRLALKPPTETDAGPKPSLFDQHDEAEEPKESARRALKMQSEREE
jgi:predicted nucleic acid-binding protein